MEHRAISALEDLMSWQRRLVELLAAGGTLAASACNTGGSGGGPCTNGGWDPCLCEHLPASGPQCVEEKSCRDHGGYWTAHGGPLDAGETTDAGVMLEGSCYVPDAGTNH